MDIYTNTLLSCTVPVSVYTTVNEPIQQHTAVRYHSCSRRTVMIFCLHQTATHFNYSRCRSQVQFVCCGCCVGAFSCVCWRRWRDWKFCSGGRLIL